MFYFMVMKKRIRYAFHEICDVIHFIVYDSGTKPKDIHSCHFDDENFNEIVINFQLD